MIERRIHNGEILDEIPGITTVTPAAPALPATAPLRRQIPPGPENCDPEELAACMAKCIAEGLSLEPKATPMELVNSLLKLTIGPGSGHKVVWTRFDIHQLFALWTNKQQNRPHR